MPIVNRASLASLCASHALLPGTKLSRDMQAAILSYYANRGTITTAQRGLSSNHAESTIAKRTTTRRISRGLRHRVADHIHESLA
jgi:hypothetical protein